MFRIMITAPASGSGKTAVTCGLLALLKKRGLKTCAFKCGPDYIDPMFHRSVLGMESHNLDLFLAGRRRVEEMFSDYSRGMDAVVCEGVMGYYDGLAGREATASPWHLSDILDIPSILVLRPKGAALSLAAVIRGMKDFRPTSRIEGVLLNDCSRSYFDRFGRMLEEESGVPVVGFLPHMEEAAFESRHLGLMTAAEIGDLQERIERIAGVLEETVDVERLLAIGSREAAGTFAAAGETDGCRAGSANTADAGTCAGTCAASAAAPVRIAVARDEAFCFAYEETLDRMRQAGGELVFFSPLRDAGLPENIGGLYLPGGYPELYAGELEKNVSMREQVRAWVAAGRPTLAECGGFLYLGRSLEGSDGIVHEMAGALPGEGRRTERLVRFGYGHIEASEDSMLFRRGERIPVHEFHYWDTTENGGALTLVKASDGRRWSFGFCGESLYAGFPHLYPAGEIDLARRFCDRARKDAEGASAGGTEGTSGGTTGGTSEGTNAVYSAL